MKQKIAIVFILLSFKLSYSQEKYSTSDFGVTMTQKFDFKYADGAKAIIKTEEGKLILITEASGPVPPPKGSFCKDISDGTTDSEFKKINLKLFSESLTEYMIVVFNNKNYIYFESRKDKNLIGSFCEITSEITPKEKSFELYSYDKGEDISDFGTVTITFSPDNKYLLVSQIKSNLNPTNRKLITKLFDNEFNQISSTSNALPKEPKIICISSAIIDNNGNYCINTFNGDDLGKSTTLSLDKGVHVLAEKEDLSKNTFFCATQSYSYKTYFFTKKDETPTSFEIASDKFLTDLGISFLPDGNVLCIGYLSEKTQNFISSMGTSIFSISKKQVGDLNVIDFSETFLSSGKSRIESKKNPDKAVFKGSERGIQHCEFDKIINLKNGETYIVSKYYTKKSFDSNDLKQLFFDYFDIVVQSLDKNYHVENALKIPKVFSYDFLYPAILKNKLFFFYPADYTTINESECENPAIYQRATQNQRWQGYDHFCVGKEFSKDENTKYQLLNDFENITFDESYSCFIKYDENTFYYCGYWQSPQPGRKKGFFKLFKVTVN